jgi:hypothetical protein
MEVAHHHPWPSNKIPHGKPISLRQLRKVEQNSLSKVQIKNPPATALTPQAIIFHIVRKIATSLVSLLNFSFELSAERGLESEHRFGLSDGRSLISMAYILLKRTITVRSANVFW